MNDDDIRALRASPHFAADPRIVALFDEALRRGEAIVRLQQAVKACPLHDDFRERIARLEHALDFYADPKIYVDRTAYEGDSPAWADGGAKARASLTGRLTRSTTGSS